MGPQRRDKFRYLEKTYKSSVTLDAQRAFDLYLQEGTVTCSSALNALPKMSHVLRKDNAAVVSVRMDVAREVLLRETPEHSAIVREIALAIAVV